MGVTKVSWEPIYSVHVVELDKQHQRLIEFMNEMYEKLDSGVFSVTEMDEFVNKLANHAEVHFGTEEKYFKEFAYDGAEDHIVQHNAIKADIKKFKDRYIKDGVPTIIFGLLEFLDNWLLVHIMEYDKKYSKCFNDHGLV